MAHRLLLLGMVAAALAVAGCGGGKKHVASTAPVAAPTIPLAKQVLSPSELPRVVRSAGVRSSRSPEILVRGLDPLFEPKILARRFTAAGFRTAAVEGIRGRGKLANTTGGASAVVRLGSAAGAASQVTFMHERSLSRCPQVNICDVFWKPFAVSGIPGAKGSVRYRKVKTTSGPAFREYYIFFSVGPNAYGEFVGGPYGTVSKPDFIRGTTSLYNRLRG
jgi:hypothetical protein